MRYIVRGLLIVFTFSLLVIIAAWLFLSSALFSSLRNNFVENLLSNKLGTPIVVEEDVRIGIGPELEISATGLVLPGASVPDTELARIDNLAFDLSARDLWKGKLSLSNFAVGGVDVTLLSTQDGQTTWPTAPKDASETKPSGHPPQEAVADLFADQEIDLSDLKITYQSAQNGLDLLFEMSELELKRDHQTGAVSAHGLGALNGETFDLKGTFPAEQPFEVTAGFDHISVTAKEVAQATGTEIKTEIAVAQLGQLLDVLKLNRVLEGSGNVSATFNSSDGVARIDDLNVGVELAGGQSLEVTGQIGELANPSDVSLTTRIRLYPKNAEPAPAASRNDLKLIAVDMVMDSVPGQTPQRQMVIETNGFTLNTSGEGPPPVKFSGLSRTQDGRLRVGNVNLRIGDPSDPFVVLNGAVEDALQLQGVKAEGILDIPAHSLISPDLRDPEDELGKFSGDFHLKGDISQLSLINLDGKTSETDLWHLEVHGTIKNVLRFEDLDLKIDVDVPSGADLLQAFSLEPVQTGAAGFAIDLVSHGADWDATADIELAESELTLTVDLDDATSDPVLQGKIESDLIRIDQIREIVLATAQLRKLGRTDPEEPAPADSGALSDVTLQPIGRSVLLSGMDMDIGIDLRHIEGAKGVSSLQSELTLNKDELKAGPLKFEYGGGQFDVNGVMDLSDDAHLLTLSGQAGGWQLDDILHNLNFQKGASGTLYADFNVTGGTESVNHFVSSMNGDATVSMRDGSIETQLLDLAGLGLLPWVFTKEKQPVAPIVCMRAPLVISGGSLSTKQTTVETDHVQVVVFGGVDLNKKVLDLNLQPRRIGKPLSRSPWPVTAQGPLSDPRIKVKDGPKRLKRSDGADQMPAQRKLCVPDILQLQ